nr:hypothetical protein [Tanacetum cinerariifolium]
MDKSEFCLLKLLKRFWQERERKKRKDYLAHGYTRRPFIKIHKMTDAKEMWETIKSIFGGNDESKKMQKYLLKQQFETFSISNLEGLHKGYDRFKSLLSQLETHGVGVSTKDANKKFLRRPCVAFFCDKQHRYGHFGKSWKKLDPFEMEEDSIFISQDKYVVEILKKFDFLSVKTVSTPIETKKPLVKDEKATDVDVHLYRSMIGSLTYLTAFRHDIMYAVITRSRFQVTSKTSHLQAVKRIFRNLKGNQNWVFGIPESQPLIWKPTQIVTMLEQIHNKMLLISWLETYFMAVQKSNNCSYFNYKGRTSAKVKTINDEVRIQALVDGKRVNIKESSIRHTLRLDDAKEAGVPFFMFPRFVQLIINHQLGDMAHHKEIFDTPSLTKKVFANMKRKKHKPKRKHTQESEVPLTESLAEQNLPSPFNDPLTSGEDSLKLKKFMDLCTNLSNKFLELESDVIDINSTYQERIEKLEGMEKSSKQERKIADIDVDVEIILVKAQPEAYNLDSDHQEKVLSMVDVNKEEFADVEEVLEVIKAAKLMTEAVTTDRATKIDKEVTRQLEAKLNADINWNVVIEQVKRNERSNDVAMKYQTLKRKPLTQAQARRNMIVYLKNMAGFKMDYFKGMTYDEIRPLFKKHYNYNQTFLDEVNKTFKVLEIVVRQEKDVKVESSKREDATSLDSNIPIIYYKIHIERNRPYFKIIRADGNHMLFISLSTMLKNFDKKDLESLWKIVRDRFKKTKPKNYSDDYLLNTLKIMFEKPNAEDSVWKDQKGRYGLAKVKSWKLIKSCGVHCITFLTTHIFLLIETMYPLTHFTLQQMLNDVRLQVVDESEMSLTLLKLARR